jgi:hypothetical protein
MILKNKVFSERIEILKRAGATDRDLAPLLSELLYTPLQELERYANRRLIEGAEILSDRE